MEILNKINTLMIYSYLDNNNKEIIIFSQFSSEPFPKFAKFSYLYRHKKLFNLYLFPVMF